MGLTFVPVDYLVAKVVDIEKNNHNNVFVRDGVCSCSPCIQVDKGSKNKFLSISKEKKGKNICRHKNHKILAKKKDIKMTKEDQVH